MLGGGCESSGRTSATSEPARSVLLVGELVVQTDGGEEVSHLVAEGKQQLLGRRRHSNHPNCKSSPVILR